MQNDNETPEEAQKVGVFTEKIPDDLQEVRQHRCKVCGKVVFEFYKDVVIVQCHGVRTIIKRDGREFTTRCKTKHWVKTTSE